jgi:pimeloyl-ACP methyl ester carboxylesterase
MPRILFLHGLESSPGGIKAVWLARRYDARVPALQTSDWATARAQAEAAVREHEPDLIIGSSFGGALLLSLLQGGVTRARAIFIAQAGMKLGLPARLPPGTRAILLHGTADGVVPIDGSRDLARDAGPGVQLWEIEGGDHPLNACLEDGTLDRAIAAALALP